MVDRTELRVMVLGLLFRWAGYRGPILGYPAGDWRPAEWWGDWTETDDAIEAARRYVCTEPLADAPRSEGARR